MTNYSRRHFFFGSLASSAAAFGLRSRAAGQTSANGKISVGVIGVGGRGSGHVEDLVKMPNVRVAALCDVNQERLERNGAVVKRATGGTPKLDQDFRNVLEMKDVDAVIIATPHHWHGVMAIWSVRAGKDVFVEKPASHVFREGRLLIEAAKKYNRIVQHGTQMRSSDTIAKAQEVIDSGILGEIKMSKAWNCQKRSHPQPVADSPAPAGVDYDLWLGPAPKRAFNKNRFEYNWHFFPEYGNGDIGGDGVHDIDLARWGLGVTTHPERITAHGSKIVLEGERNFPDNMIVAYQYAEGKVLIYEDRIWTPYGQHGVDSGDAVYGTEGYMLISRRGWFRTYIGKNEEKGPAMKGNGGGDAHVKNFLDCVQTRKTPNAPPEVAHLSCGLVQLGEIAYRVGRILHFDPQREIFPDDAEATARLTKVYREPWTIPDPV